jgi:hypothetical protein
VPDGVLSAGHRYPLTPLATKGRGAFGARPTALAGGGRRPGVDGAARRAPAGPGRLARRRRPGAVRPSTVPSPRLPARRPSSARRPVRDLGATAEISRRNSGAGLCAGAGGRAGAVPAGPHLPGGARSPAARCTPHRDPPARRGRFRLTELVVRSTARRAAPARPQVVLGPSTYPRPLADEAELRTARPGSPTSACAGAGLGGGTEFDWLGRLRSTTSSAGSTGRWPGSGDDRLRVWAERNQTVLCVDNGKPWLVADGAPAEHGRRADATAPRLGDRQVVAFDRGASGAAPGAGYPARRAIDALYVLELLAESDYAGRSPKRSPASPPHYAGC